MNKKILLIGLLIIFLAFVVSVIREFGEDFSNNNQTLKQEDPYVQGKIYDIQENRILVAEGYNEKAEHIKVQGNAVWLTITQDTEIIGGKINSFNELEEKTNIKAWITGPVLESYPAQATASKIIILEKEEIAYCYIGGCSGELCTNNPEAMSTCEWLPGMECLKEDMSCELVENECTWVLSGKAVSCFLDILDKEGDYVKETRIGHLFEKALNF